MQIHVTVRELLAQRAWEKFCDMRGLNVYAVKEGLIDNDAHFVLSVEEVRELGIDVSPNSIDRLSDLDRGG